jgi:mRNA interferase MazF
MFMEIITRLETVLRGEIWVAELDDAIGSEQQNRRPVVILQADTFNETSPTTIIAPITSQIKHPFMRSHVILSRLCPLQERSMVLCEQVRVIDRRRLDYYVGRLGSNDMRGVEQAVSFCLGLDGGTV